MRSSPLSWRVHRGFTGSLAWVTRLMPLASGALAFAMLSCGAATSTDAGPATPTVEYLTEQEILTPLPLRVRLPASYGAEHVIVLYRTWGSRGWSQLELARDGQTWTGVVSCRQVSTVTGDTRYFFVARDADGELVGGSVRPTLFVPMTGRAQREAAERRAKGETTEPNDP